MRRTPVSCAAIKTLRVPTTLTRWVSTGRSIESIARGNAAVWKTQSTPSNACLSESPTRMSASITSAALFTYSRRPVAKLSRRRTRIPYPIRASTRCEPINPAPPVTATRRAVSLEPTLRIVKQPAWDFARTRHASERDSEPAAADTEAGLPEPGLPKAGRTKGRPHHHPLLSLRRRLIGALLWIGHLALELHVLVLLIRHFITTKQASAVVGVGQPVIGAAIVVDVVAELEWRNRFEPLHLLWRLRRKVLEGRRRQHGVDRLSLVPR